MNNNTWTLTEPPSFSSGMLEEKGYYKNVRHHRAKTKEAGKESKKHHKD